MLTEAIEENDLVHVRKAIANGASLTQLDESGRSMLVMAMSCEKLDIMRELCTAELINLPNAIGTTPLLLAVHKRKLKLVNTLLAHEDVDVNKTDSYYGHTPLNVAAYIGELEIVEALLKKKDIDVNLADLEGRTPLSVAAGVSRHIGVVKLLLNAGADVNKPDNNGKTPLYSFPIYRRDNYEIVLQLLRCGANPNVLCNFHSPLFEFAIRGDVRTARLLIAAGTDLYDFHEPYRPIVEDILKSTKTFLWDDIAIDVAMLLYVALDNREFSMQSIQRLEHAVHLNVSLNAMREKLNDEEIVADVKKQLSDEKVEWIMHGAKGQNRIVDVVMAMKPMVLPTLVIVVMLMFDNPRLVEIPFHVVWDLVERIVRFKFHKE